MAEEKKQPTGKRTVIDRKEQKKELLDKRPDAQLFIVNSRLGEPIFRALKIIDAADEALLSQWAYGDVDDDTVREWNKAFSKFKETAQELKDLAVKSVAKSKSDKALYIGVLKKEVAQYLEENKEKEEKSSK